jgi:ketosteroid isomerase-like protein
MIRVFTRLAVVATLVGACAGMARTQSGTTVSDTQASDARARKEIRAVLDRYVKSVEEADEAILRELWVRADDASYVNPMQRLRSWGEVQGFWQGFLKSGFTRRELKPDNVVINMAGDVAWAVFDWEFNGIQTDGKPMHSRGWETHVYQRTDRGWRITHAHYSAAAVPPPTGAKAAQPADPIR